MFTKRKEIEKQTVFQMIKIYCNANHNTSVELCENCQSIYEYALLKYENCPFIENKPVCSKCKVHCYSKSKREEIRRIMRYSGPRMLFKHPLNTLVYFYYKLTVKTSDIVSIERNR